MPGSPWTGRTLVLAVACLAAALLAPGSAAGGAQDEYGAARREMLRAIESMAADTSSYTGIERLDEKVMAAMDAVPRHEFVPAYLRRFAYLNRPLPIGEEQTISQPYIVALMTHLAAVNGDSVVLEVGTGSGYQAAVLSRLVRRVYSIEIIETLGRRAESALARLGFDNVTVKIGDGYNGWEEHAPYDAILVTAAPEETPEPLLRQLKTGARLVIPVGPQGRSQSLRVLEKQPSGAIEEENVLPVGFVPLVRGAKAGGAR